MEIQDKMRRFGIHHPLYFSFFSKELYQDVGRRWKGLAFGYLLFLLALAWILPMLQLHVGFQDFLQTQAPGVLSQLPRITITKGKVEVDPPGQHVIKDPDTGKPFLLIDTEQDLPPLDSLPDNVIVLTRSKLMVKQSARGETRIQDLSNVDHFSMDRTDAERWLRFAGSWLGVALYLIVVPFSFVYRMIQVFLYALIGMLFARGTNVALSYPVLVRLSVIAITPAVVVDTLKDLTPLQIPLWWLMCFLIAMFYLHFGVKAMAEPVPASPAPDAATNPPGLRS